MAFSLGGFVGSAISSVADIFGAERQHQFAEKQLASQQDFAATPHQREVRDLTEAGLNPMLGIMKGGGAPMPGTVGIPHRQNPVAAGANTAAQIAQLGNIEAQTDLLRAQTETEKKRPANVEQLTSTSNQQAIHYNSQTNNLIAEIHNIRARLPLIKSEEQRNTAAANLARIETRLKGLEVPAAMNSAKAAETWWKQNVHPFIGDVKDIATTVSSAVGAAAAGRFLGRGLESNRGRQGISIHNHPAAPAASSSRNPTRDAWRQK